MSTKKAIPAALKQKMAASVVGTGPSLIPQPHTPKPKEQEEEVIPSIDDLILETEERDTLRKLVAAQLPLNAQKKVLEKQIEGFNARIKVIVANYGIDKAVCDGATISMVQSSRSTVNPLKLLAEGVTQDVIDLCTDTTPIQTLTIRGPK